MPNYIEKRRRLWYAVLDIPKDVRPKLAHKRRFVQSLKTESQKQALRLAAPVIARWKQQIATARGEGDDLVIEARVLRDLLRKEKDPEQREVLENYIDDRTDSLWQKGAPRHILDAGEAREASTTAHLAERFANVALGLTVGIEEHFEAFLSEADVAEKTMGDHRRAIRDLTKHFTNVGDIDRKEASRFARETLGGLAPATVNRRLTTYRGYWQWLANRGFIPENRSNPWDRQSLKVKDRDQQDRRPFTEEEGAELLAMLAQRSNQYPDDLAATMLMAVTGMRVNEVTTLEAHNVSFKDNVAWVTVEQGKTKAAKRTIPVVAAAVITELKKRVGSGYVFNRLGDASNQNGRGNAYKKRVGRLVDKIDPDPLLVANHSWRYRAVKLLGDGGIDRHIADYFVGHAQKGEGLRRYYKGNFQQHVLEAARLITIPKAAAGNV